MEDNDFKMMVLTAVDKLLAQGGASMVGFNNGCMYRGPRGLCCIIGFMMDDDTAYKADDEPHSSILDIIQTGIWGEDLTDAQKWQLHVLQGCHDFAQDCETFNEEFIRGVNTERSLLWIAEHIAARKLR
jgi:hypothetical protein